MIQSTINHSEATQERLVPFAKSVPGAWIGLKVAALLLLLEGQRPGWVVQVLGLQRMSLNRWVRGVNMEGLKALLNKNRPGRPSRLTPRIAQEVEHHLEESPQLYGLNRARWDGPTLVVHLKRQFGIKLKVRQAQNWMHQLGYRLKRASYTYLQASGEEAKRFQAELKKTQKSGSPGDDRFPG